MVKVSEPIVELIHGEPPKQRIGKQTGVISRACSKCGGDLKERYGKQRYCHACHAAHMRETRPKHKELKEDARKKANCRSYSRVYFLRGKIKKASCVKCGSEDSQRHHPDYNNPLHVVWMCRECHLEYHREAETLKATQLSIFPANVG
jgi:hypothetical protein